MAIANNMNTEKTINVFTLFVISLVTLFPPVSYKPYLAQLNVYPRLATSFLDRVALHSFPEQ